MTGMIGTPVSKGKMNAAWDELHSTAKGRAWCLAELKKSRGKPITEMLLHLKLVSKGQAAHLEKHWLPDKPPGYWPRSRPKGDILREGYIKALEVAIAADVPTSSYWICTGEAFEVMILKGAMQVTILVATPEVPADTVPTVAQELQDIWIVCSADTADELLQPFEENWMHAPDPKTMLKPKRTKTGAKGVNAVQAVWP